MKHTASLLSITLACAAVATPQGRPVDWPSIGGDARRSGWEKSDIRITKDNAKDFKLVLKRKLEGPTAGARALTPPVVIGLLISYKGFKELGFVAGNSGDLWSIDVDTNKEFWHQRYPVAKGGSALCAGLASAPSLVPPAVFGGRRPAAGAVRPAQLPARLGGGGFGGPRPIYFVAGDGKLRQVNTSDGSDRFPSLDFMPAGSKVSNLVMTDNTVFAASSGNCGGTPNALYAIDLAQEETKPVSFPLPAGDAISEFAVGNNGMVFVQTSTQLYALSGKDLQRKAALTLGSAKATATVTAPTVFEYKGKDLVAAARDGKIYLIDSEAPDAPIATSAQVGNIGAGLSTWEDGDGVRWIAAPVHGAVSTELKAAASNGAAPNGSIVAFRIEDKGGKPELVPAWVSRDLKAPVAPVVTSGNLFALSTAGRAVLYGFDWATGKELYSSGAQVTAPGSLTGLTLANGRVFFTTTDNTLYGFGIFLEI
ncbi:PQQ-binding-like beta-propeller repeat protein [Bryobacter aggregatus]|uniref:PQQ-binding-like beta-propeller repeat protein n=1 Tax=Bryobacter aggregatus TaxID=360054 RepID=UPI0004E19384|nr:PQQ-binding-like beta-propeller repeat protein [Bryobacter aggregatus]